MNRYMTFWPRFWAGCIDGFALGVISMGVYFPLSLLLGLAVALPRHANAERTQDARAHPQLKRGGSALP